MWSSWSRAFRACRWRVVRLSVRFLGSTRRGCSMSAVNVLSGEVASSPQAAGTTRRRLVVAWQHPTERSICPVGILSFDGSRYRFHYIANVRSEADFRPFLGFPDFAATYESDHLFPLFSQRAMAPRRPDYRRWVTRLGLDDDATPWEQIARSGGRREGDTIQLFPVPRIDEGLLACSFLVHGIRHIPESSLTYGQENHTISRDELEEELSRLHPGDRLLLADEPHNPFNPRAILTTTAADCAGRNAQQAAYRSDFPTSASRSSRRFERSTRPATSEAAYWIWWGVKANADQSLVRTAPLSTCTAKYLA